MKNSKIEKDIFAKELNFKTFSPALSHSTTYIIEEWVMSWKNIRWQSGRKKFMKMTYFPLPLQIKHLSNHVLIFHSCGKEFLNVREVVSTTSGMFSFEMIALCLAMCERMENRKNILSMWAFLILHFFFIISPAEKIFSKKENLFTRDRKSGEERNTLLVTRKIFLFILHFYSGGKKFESEIVKVNELDRWSGKVLWWPKKYKSLKNKKIVTF